MSLKFETVKPLNAGGLKMIPIKTNEGGRLIVKTGKCFSFGVKKDKRFKTTSMSLVLDLKSIKRLEDIIAQSEEHLGSPLSKKVLHQKEEKTTIYPKFKDNTKFSVRDGGRDKSYEIRRQTVRRKGRFGSRKYSFEWRSNEFTIKIVRSVSKRTRIRTRAQDEKTNLHQICLLQICCKYEICKALQSVQRWQWPNLHKNGQIRPLPPFHWLQSFENFTFATYLHQANLGQIQFFIQW